MNIVVDTNIVFSALMSANTKMGQIIFTDKTDTNFIKDTNDLLELIHEF